MYNYIQVYKIINVDFSEELNIIFKMPRFKVIKIKEEAMIEIAEDAIKGYEKRYKQERLGFMLGYFNEGTLIYEAIPYRGGKKTRTQIIYNQPKLIERGNELAIQRKKKVIGLYHTHPELGGERCYTMSDEDKDSFLLNPYFAEMVVAVAPSGMDTDFELHYNQDGSITIHYGSYYLRYTIFYKKGEKIRKGKLKIA